MEQNETLKAAYEANIEVRWAKRPSDIKLEGVHLIEPGFKEIMEGLESALFYGCKSVIVHSRLTWPYSLFRD